MHRRLLRTSVAVTFERIEDKDFPVVSGCKNGDTFTLTAEQLFHVHEIAVIGEKVTSNTGEGETSKN
jgi:hypothetical protein